MVKAKLDKETLKNLSQLSRIKCTDEELDLLLVDLQKVLAYVEQLDEVDTSDFPVCNHVLPSVYNVMREDVVGETLPRELFLANAPSHTGGLIKVPPVMKQD